jgi:UDP-N-acetylmuramate: L-alanyl-gamma-D-glutamyl-meso-diaminopimelate ligase
MSGFLDRLGLRYAACFSVGNLQPRPDLVVVGNAISRGNVELEQVLDEGISYRSLPQVVAEEFLVGKQSLVVAGTHGKTTTASLLAWIFQVGGRKPNFLVGGIAENFGSSYALGGGPDFIIEGDEYDSAYFDKAAKFFHYRPDGVILTSVEYDHADIYPDLEAIKLAFKRLVNLVPRRGWIVAWAEAESVRECTAKAFCRVVPYAFNNSDSSGWVLCDLRQSPEGMSFEARDGKGRSIRCQTTLSGEFNALNIVAALAAAMECGIEKEAIEEAVRTFRSVQRRMEVKGEADGVIVIDDFAHHPTAIRETLKALKAKYPGRRIWALVEPRSNTLRRKVFEVVLPDALSLADCILIAPVSRRHLLSDAERLSPENVAAELRKRGKTAAAVPDADTILRRIEAEAGAGDVVVALSNGGFENIPQRILERLASRGRLAERKG